MPRSVRLALFGAAFMVVSAGMLIAQSQAPEPAQKILDAALAKAKAENKAVFVHFSASW